MCLEFPQTRTEQNECFEMLNNEKGMCMFMLSTDKCYNENLNHLNKF
jgi:hypothetical protein